MSFEKYNVPEGYIMIAFSDKKLSVGILGINPGKELAKHNRPVLESLYQIKGSCVMKLFEEDGKIKEVVLKEGESIDIPPFKFHIHSNPNKEESIAFWKASGDIVGIINKIRRSSNI